MKVIDVVLVSDFALLPSQRHQLQQDVERAGLQPLWPASDVRLLPVRTSDNKVRTPLLSCAKQCIDDWMSAPVVSILGPRRVCHRGQVCSVIQSWGSQYTILAQGHNVVWQIWPPLALAVLHRDWKVLAYSAPWLNRFSKRKQLGLWHAVFGHIEKLHSTKKPGMNQDTEDSVSDSVQFFMSACSFA
eukprot:6454959-Amphidinium_carterae.1